MIRVKGQIQDFKIFDFYCVRNSEYPTQEARDQAGLAKVVIDHLFDFDARAMAYKTNKTYKIYSFTINNYSVIGVAEHVFFQNGDEVYAVIDHTTFTDINLVYAIYHPEQKIIYSLPQHGFTSEGLKRRKKIIGLSALVFSSLISFFLLFTDRSNDSFFMDITSFILTSAFFSLLGYFSTGWLYKKASEESLKIYQTFGFPEPEKIDFRKNLYEHKTSKIFCRDIAYLDVKLRE